MTSRSKIRYLWTNQQKCGFWFSHFWLKFGQIKQKLGEYVSNDYNLYTRIKNWLPQFRFWYLLWPLCNGRLYTTTIVERLNLYGPPCTTYLFLLILAVSTIFIVTCSRISFHFPINLNKNFFTQICTSFCWILPQYFTFVTIIDKSVGDNYHHYLHPMEN